MTWNAKASSNEKQIINKSYKGENAKVQLSTPCVKAWLSSPFCHSFSTQNQPDLLVAGDSLFCSLVMDSCATVQGITLPSVCVKLGHIKKDQVQFFFPKENLAILFLKVEKIQGRVQLFLVYCSKSSE